MRTKSLIRSSRKSLDSQSRNRIEKLEGCEEIVPDKKRHCAETNETDKGGFEFDACIVCGVCDMLVYRCCGADCIISFHGECLPSEFGGSDDLANPFCPYCWFKFVALKSKSLREKAIGAEKAMFKYLDKDMKEKDPDKSNMPLTEETEQQEEQDLQDAKDNDETAKVNTCVGKKGDVSRLSSLQESYSGKEHDQVQQKEKQSRRRIRKRVELNDATDSKSVDMKEDQIVALGDQERVNIENLEDSEHDDETAIVEVKSGGVESYSGKEHDKVQQHENQSSRRRRRVVLDDDSDCEISSTMVPNGEDITEEITSENNQQRKLTTKVVAAESKTPREGSFFKKDHRRRLLWTSKEEEMLKVGVEKYAAEANKNIPWRKILKMGENVFHKTRSSADLKDKWRNMIKLM